MGLLAADVIDMPAVDLQRRALAVIVLQRFVRQLQQLRREKRRGGGEIDPGGGDAADQLLVCADAGVLIAAALGVIGQLVQQDREGVVQLQQRQQLVRRGREDAGEPGELARQVF